MAVVPTGYGEFIVGDGSGGGGGNSMFGSGGAGGNGGGNNDILSGTNYNDVIFGDGSGGGGGLGWWGGGAGGVGGGGNDTLYGGNGNDILFGDGFNGDNGTTGWAGSGGFGGGGGGGTGSSAAYYAGAGGLGGGAGGGARYTLPYGQSSLMTDNGEQSNGGAGFTNQYGYVHANGGGGGFGAAGYGGNATLAANATAPAGHDGGTGTYSATDNSGSLYNRAYYEVTNNRIYHSTAGTTNGYGAGSDILDGGAGSDHYFGMGGADTFIVSAQDNAATDVDTIWDFKSSDSDKIQLEDASGNILTTAQVNTLLGSAAIGTDTTLTMSDGSQLIIKGVTNLTAADFLVACFLPGTQFETLDGMKAIEELQIGEMMKTAEGYAPLKWLARREVNWAMSIPRRVAPVLVKQGALGNNLPLRDLYISPAHALEIDGVLVNAELLVNGSTIVQLLDYDQNFTYFNIELESHSIVYAEGAAVESYLEVGDNRNSYDNAAEFHQLYPHHVVPEAMEMGRITLKRQMLSLRKAAA